MKYRFLASTLLGAVVVAGSVWAVDTTIDVSAKMRLGLTFTNPVNMDFTPTTQFIDFFGTPSAASTVALGTDGVEVQGGTALVPTTLTGTPGSVDINGAFGVPVFISCDPTAILADPVTGTQITVDTMQISMNTGTAFATPGYTCAGMGTTPFSHTLDGTDGVDTILIGGRLVGNANINTATYSTTNPTGVPANVRVIYQ